MVRRRQREAVKRCKTLDAESTFLAVYRLESSVYYKRLAAAEFLILSELRRGTPLGEALARVPDESALPPEEFGPKVEGWFTTWSRLGWLCSPKGPEA